MTKDIGFIPNSDDDLHCLQASYWMIAKHFKPDLSIDWLEWSKITGFEKDKGTWPIAGLVWFYNHDFDVKHIETFNFEQFAADGEAYLKERYPGPTGEWAIKHTNVTAEQERAKELSEINGVFINREPTQEDIKLYLDDGYIVRAHVNSRQLNGKSGYIGHAVVVFDYNNEGFYIHDPGPPPIKNRYVHFQDFKKAWLSSDDGSAEMDAIKLLNS